MWSRFLLPALLLNLGVVVRCQEDGGFVSSIPRVTPQDCISGPGVTYHQYYDISQMRCEECAQNTSMQVQSADGLSCECITTHRRRDFQVDKQFQWECVPCPDGQVASLEGYECVTCDTVANPPDDSCPLCNEGPQLTAERDLTGERFSDIILNDTDVDIRTCVDCSSDTSSLGTGRRCVRCNQQLSVYTTCDCPTVTSAGGLCFQNSADLEPVNNLNFQVQFDNLPVAVSSAFLQENLQAAQAMCTNYATVADNRMDYSNLTACQTLGNMCVMFLYSGFDPRTDITGSAETACSLHLRLADPSISTVRFDAHPIGNSELWRRHMPWLYYGVDEAEDVLDDNSLPTEFRQGDRLRFRVASYNVTGHYKGMYDLTESMLTVCPGDARRVEAAFLFGTNFRTTCRFTVEQLLQKTTEFYDIYLEYEVNGVTRLQPVPVLVKNYLTRDGTDPNRENDRTEWQMTRRLFLVDNVSGREGSTENLPSAIRYADEVIFHVNLQATQRNRILVPWVEVNYTDISTTGQEQITKPVMFRMMYGMDLGSHSQNLSIAMGVLSVMAVLFAGLQTSNHNRREGKIAIDCATILYYFLFLTGTLANAFFVVIFGWSLWWLIVYKGQDSMFLVPDVEADYYIRAFLGSAFALKAISLIFMIVQQCTVDLFLIDWEKGRKDKLEEAAMALHLRGEDAQEAAGSSAGLRSGPGTPSSSSSSPQKQTGITKRGTAMPKPKKNYPVSIWRTYFVANEWNELQTFRRINPFLQILLTILILYGAGVENLARFDTVSILESPGRQANGVYRGEFSIIFRFAIGSAIFLGVALAQWLFYKLIWSRFKTHPVLDFVDLCSSCNVSVFIMTNEQYGHYVHGRSNHGATDVGLRQTYENMAREEQDMCGTRGLQPQSEQQSFEVFIPKSLRNKYNQVLFDVWKASQMKRQARTGVTTATTGGGKLPEDMIKRLEAYSVLNKFLQAFLDHNIPNIEYDVINKTFIEKILDTEFIQNYDQGYFYSDYGHSYDKAIFYGNEWTLQMFNVLFFTVMDLATGDFILAGVLTYVLEEIVSRIRAALGQKNIVKKTMIDERFLI